ncbi:hypothetical protein AMAG_03105 [Allomyces macrogynus ATCC 38327]|uniref:Cytochrome c oxidase assembly protein CtaG/Cox11 n=1 Tax=Allomyces macrogynus (strain ATCC 38327) TaxID=578462 RepID=A0A0L0S4B0_ALLM3|nr:hypothetical protein AMAG_03105 [Allomyces macrogynus ATCC 38327]|eukprot:KNE57383.1 hypothetical protein AMAG_03105 [Allomyces macrogynus ATCC 38327]
MSFARCALRAFATSARPATAAARPAAPSMRQFAASHFGTRFASTTPTPTPLPRSSTSGGIGAHQPPAWQRQQARTHQRNQSALYYTTAVFITFIGLSYTAVPLYRLFCSATGVGGTVQTSKDAGADDARFSPDNMVPVTSRGRKLKITFNADTARALDWTFRPQQRVVEVVPGETALAFYTAKNRSDQDVIGISTYNVMPAQAGPYFNKIQCFCFEEQKLRAGEEVDMPVFFFIDPAFLDDPNTVDVNEITLSYTFFNARTIDTNRLHALNPRAYQEPPAAVAAPSS